MVEQSKQDQASKKEPAEPAASAGKELARTAKNAASPAMMPLFYKNPRPVDPARHSAMSLKTEVGFAFARQTNSVPLNVVEFFAAARHFPIVFATEPMPTALAVLGVRPDENLFVDELGHWQNGGYVPAYVRRYPFIFFESDDRQTLSLCIDEAADALSESDVRPLFRDGEPTAAARGALDFCAAFQREHVQTQAFVTILQETDLLMPCQANMTLKSGEQLSLAGFQVIDIQKLNALSDKAFLALRGSNGLANIYSHLASQGSWQSLIDLSAKAPRGAKRASPPDASGRA